MQDENVRDREHSATSCEARAHIASVHRASHGERGTSESADAECGWLAKLQEETPWMRERSCGVSFYWTSGW